MVWSPNWEDCARGWLRLRQQDSDENRYLLNHVKLWETMLAQIYTQVLSNMSFRCMGSPSRGGQHESEDK